MSSEVEEARAALREYALSLPEAYEDFPWGESVAKVNKKVFAFFGRAEQDTLSCSLKLPQSAAEVLELPFAEPTGYGLGKSGWVTVTFPPGECPPLDVVAAWVDESFRAVAPKRISKLLDARDDDA